MSNNYILKKDEIKQGHYIQPGSSIIKVMQNTTTEVLDLLVRESIQNSLDASTINKDVVINFNIKKFNKDKVFDLMEGLNKAYFNAYFPNVEQQQIIISDKNTTGLTGNPQISEERNSNLAKLIYGLGRSQTLEGAGGSWGYGKTIYYRIGIGLVLFYSRVRLSFGKYSERLAISLIENQTRRIKIAVPVENDYTGINFWGDLDKNNESIPITCESKIEKILRAFNIERYKGDETGTLISIPFINEEKLIDNVNANKKYIYDDLEEFFFLAVQRWYAPRLNNDKYKYGNKNNLVVYINNQRIEYHEQDKLFKLVKEMYVYAITNNKRSLQKEFPNLEINKEKINVMAGLIDGMVGREVGDFVYTKLKYSDLDMQNPNQLNNPYALINRERESEEAKENPPIILMVRQPGMVVNYDIDEKWTNRMVATSPEEYIIGLFVLNSGPDVYFNTDDGRLSLEEYIRSSEESDHFSWGDKGHRYKNKLIEPRIVNKIKTNIRGKVNNKFREKPKYTQTESTSYLQNLFGQLIMPQGFGTRATNIKRPKLKAGSAPRGRKAQVGIQYGKARYLPNELIIPFYIQPYKKDFEFIEFRASIQAEGQVYSIKDYRSFINQESPILLKDLKVNDKDINIEKDIEFFENGVVRFYSEIFTEDELLKGEIILTNNDKNIVPKIVYELKKVENDGI